MAFRSGWLGAAVAGMVGIAGLSPASAYLFWTRPQLGSSPAVGDEPGIVLPLVKATPKEMRANLLWTLRAGLNVAALQCQFAPALRTVANYNNMLHQHAAELQATYATLTAYFKRTAGKRWQTELDQYTTRTYNSFSTLQAQRIFCETAATIGRETMIRPRGQLGEIAAERIRELRNSLVPAGDASFAVAPARLAVAEPLLSPVCFDKKGRVKACKKPKAQR